MSSHSTFTLSRDVVRPDTPVVICYMCERRAAYDGTAKEWIGWVRGPDGEAYCRRCMWLTDDQIVLEAIDEGCNYLSEILDHVCVKVPEVQDRDERLVRASLTRLCEAGFVWSYGVLCSRRGTISTSGSRLRDFYVCKVAQVRERWREPRLYRTLIGGNITWQSRIPRRGIGL